MECPDCRLLPAAESLPYADTVVERMKKRLAADRELARKIEKLQDLIIKSQDSKFGEIRKFGGHNT
jgi:hypothetical protein